jgi:TRAP-type C4-dicarboxylate transport system permease small subunit
MKKKLMYIWDHFEGTLIIMFFAAILITVFVQVASRLIFNDPLMFTEELARFLYLWMVFLGFSYITKKGRNLCLEIVASKVKGRKKAVFNIVISLFTIVTFAYIGYWSVEYIKFSWINPAPAMRFSLGIVYLVVPISMLLCVIRSIELIVKDVQRLQGKLPLDSGTEAAQVAKEIAEEGGAK